MGRPQENIYYLIFQCLFRLGLFFFPESGPGLAFFQKKPKLKLKFEELLPIRIVDHYLEFEVKVVVFGKLFQEKDAF